MSAIATRPGHELGALLEAAKPKLLEVLPKHLAPERMIRLALAAHGKSAKLKQCTPQSLLYSVLVAARLGLEPDGVLGAAYLVPYGNECQLVPGYRGLIDLARRSGVVKQIRARVVRTNDVFKWREGVHVDLVHDPNVDEEPGELRLVYAVAELEGGEVQWEVMSRGQVEKVRRGSKSANSPAWTDHFEEMARKTVVRRLCKYLPLSVELASACRLQKGAEVGESYIGEVVDTLGVRVPEVEGRVDKRPPARAAARQETTQDAGGGPKVATAPQAPPPASSAPQPPGAVAAGMGLAPGSSPLAPDEGAQSLVDTETGEIVGYVADPDEGDAAEASAPAASAPIPSGEPKLTVDSIAFLLGAKQERFAEQLLALAKAESKDDAPLSCDAAALMSKMLGTKVVNAAWVDAGGVFDKSGVRLPLRGNQLGGLFVHLLERRS